MHAQPVSIDVRQGLQKFHASELICHFDVAEVTVSGAFKSKAATARTPVVEHEDYVAAFGHIDLPAANHIISRGFYVADSGSAVDINDRRILFVRVKVCRLHQPVEKIGRVVGRLDRTASDFRHVVTGPRVSSRQEVDSLSGCGGREVDFPHDVGRRPQVAHESTRGRKAGVVASRAAVEGGTLAGDHVDGIEVGLDGRRLGRRDDEALLLDVETEQVEHHKVTARQLAQFLARRIEEVKVVEAVAFALVDELGVVPRQEDDRVLGMDILGVTLGVKHSLALSCGGVVGHKLGLVLRTGKLNHVDGTLVGRPGNVREITVGGIARVEVDGLLRSRVIDAHGDLVARHAGHGIFVGSIAGGAVADVDLRIVGHHRLVHAIERKEIAFGTPKRAFCNAKLIAVYTLSVHQFTRTVG